VRSPHRSWIRPPWRLQEQLSYYVTVESSSKGFSVTSFVFVSTVRSRIHLSTSNSNAFDFVSTIVIVHTRLGCTASELEYSTFQVPYGYVTCPQHNYFPLSRSDHNSTAGPMKPRAAGLPSTSNPTQKSCTNARATSLVNASTRHEPLHRRRNVIPWQASPAASSRSRWPSWSSSPHRRRRAAWRGRRRRRARRTTSGWRGTARRTARWASTTAGSGRSGTVEIECKQQRFGNNSIISLIFDSIYTGRIEEMRPYVGGTHPYTNGHTRWVYMINC
jgi:hypothetical protein